MVVTGQRTRGGRIGRGVGRGSAPATVVEVGGHAHAATAATAANAVAKASASANGKAKVRARGRGAKQQAFEFRTHGGAREGAGRKPRLDRKGFVGHGRRPAHDARHPMHITVRAVGGCPDLRSERLFNVIERELGAAVARGHGIVEYSVQSNHLHLIVEADAVGPGAKGIGRRMQHLLSRVTRAVNGAARRRGRLWSDRYHRSDITSPTQMKRTLSYVLFNDRRHTYANLPKGGSVRGAELSFLGLDPCSSAPWVADWDERAPPPPRQRRTTPSGLALKRTWLARVGWKRCGLLRFDALPSH